MHHIYIYIFFFSSVSLDGSYWTKHNLLLVTTSFCHYCSGLTECRGLFPLKHPRLLGSWVFLTAFTTVPSPPHGQYSTLSGRGCMMYGGVRLIWVQIPAHHKASFLTSLEPQLPIWKLGMVTTSLQVSVRIRTVNLSVLAQCPARSRCLTNKRYHFYRSSWPLFFFHIQFWKYA